MKKKLICFVLTTVMLITSLSALQIHAANDYFAEYGMSCNDLFMKYPAYLYNGTANQAIRNAESAYSNVISKYSGTDEYISALKTGAASGLEIIIRGIGSSMGLMDSYYDTCMDKATLSLIRNIYADENSVAALSIVTDASKNFKWIKKAPDISVGIIETAASNMKNLSKDDVEQITKAVKDNCSKVLDPTTDMMDIAKLALTACVIEDTQLEMIDLLIEKSDRSGELYKGLTRIRNDMKSGIVKYTLENFIEKKALKELSSKIMKFGWDVLNISRGSAIIGGLIVETAMWVLFDVIFPHPDADTVISNLILTMYTNELDVSLSNQREVFNSPFLVSDMNDYQILFTMFLSAINTTIDSTMELAKTTGDEAALSAAKQVFKTVLPDFDTYIDYCMEACYFVPDSERVKRTVASTDYISVTSGKTVVVGNVPEDVTYNDELPLTSDNSTLWGVHISEGNILIYKNAITIPDLVISKGTLNGTDIITDSLNISGTSTITAESITSAVSASLAGTIHSTVNVQGNLSGNNAAVDNLNISGTKTQNIVGTLNAQNLTYSNTGTAKQTGTIYVTGSVKNASSRVTGGQNTVLKSTGYIDGEHYNSALTLDGVVVESKKTFGGSLYTVNNVSVKEAAIGGDLFQSSGTLALNGSTSVSGDSYFGGTVTQNDNTYFCGGDISVSTNNTFKNIVAQGKVLQTLTGILNVENFTNRNIKGIKVNDTVKVSGTLDNTYGKINGMGMTLLSGGSFGSDTYNGDVTVQSTCSMPTALSGNVLLMASENLTKNTNIGGDFTVNTGTTSIENCILIVNGRLTNSSAITANENSNVTFNSSATNSGTISGNGNYTVNGVLSNNGTISDCNLTLSKELSNNGTININSFTTNSEVYNGNSLSIVDLWFKPKTFFAVGGNAINTQNLYLEGNGKVVLNTTINVSGDYTNSGVTVNDEKIIVSSGKSITEDRTYKGLNLTTDLYLDNCTLTVDTLTISGGIYLSNGARLIVNKMLLANGSSKTISVDAASSIIIKRLSSISSYSDIIIDGSLTFESDAALSSTKISGNGAINVNGDFYCNSVTINKPKSFNIRGKTPQVITCSGASFDNLTVTNPCKAGVTFSSTVYCYGTYDKGTSAVTGTVTQK